MGVINRPKVSIIVCTYNRQEYLDKTLKSIFEIDYDSFEVIVVDNNSSDNTKQVVEKYPAKYILETQQGVSHARNAGLENSQGDYVGFIDDDEIVAKEWIEGMLKGFAMDSSVAVVTGPVIPRYDIEPPEWMPKTFHGEVGGSVYKLLSSKELVGTGNSLFRADLVRNIRFATKLGRVKDSLISGEDTDYVQKLYNQGYLGAYSPDAAVDHLIPSDRTTLKWFMNRYFAEGITEYLRKGVRVFWRRIYKPIPDLIALFLALLTFNLRIIIKRWLRLCQTIGILSGPFYRLLKK